MSGNEILLYLAIAALVVWRVVIRQLRGSTLTVRGLALIPGILVVLGVANCVHALPGASGGELAFLGVDLVLLVAFGAARSASTSLTSRDGYAFQKGTTLTLFLWLATVATRVGLSMLGVRLNVAGALTSASLLLSIGLSIGTQNALIYARARRLGFRIATTPRAPAVRP
ncbi:MAG TPA: hypothetical protein VJT49_26860 [Amycolatopsis sp.]|uniref:hypothetical protein n=1 Tax=Amycolatopsis sp. TaxID=37632 RepID=UPI002B47B996|nr:hypothetical protein [Amycolatopsis sp.]HKS48662.1 hypothetical protein [Amycolatopsis sp.]